MGCPVSVLTALTLVGVAASLPAHEAANPAVNTARMLWEPMVGYITSAAEELPESTYAYRPTPEVRSFGQLVGHVAGAQYLICAAPLGDPPRKEDDIEKQQKTKLFGQERTRLYALGLNATHDGEHYGNIVTYLRLNGIVPPSSRQQ